MLEIEELTTDLFGPVSLSVPAGTLAVLTGASGSGKSLMLRAVADLDPNRGRVVLNGQDRAGMEAPDWRRRVALVPAESGWWTDRVGPHFRPAPDPAPMLDRLGLAEALGWEVARLSTGEKQRLALARALQLAPEALLLDEPTAALDPEAVARVEALIRDLAGQGAAVLMVTHDATQADRLADAHYRMIGGRLEQAA